MDARQAKHEAYAYVAHAINVLIDGESVDTYYDNLGLNETEIDKIKKALVDIETQMRKKSDGVWQQR